MQYWQFCIAFTPKQAGLVLFFLLNDNLIYIFGWFKKVHTTPACSAVRAFQSCQGGCHYVWFVTHLKIDMSENDSSHIDTVADSVGSDTCQYSWVFRVYNFLLNRSTTAVH